MSLKDRINKKFSSKNLFGMGHAKLDDDDIYTKQANVLKNQVKNILKDVIGLDELWFQNNYWWKRQRDIAFEMVKARDVDFWVEVLRWCLNHPTDNFARKVRNLRALVNYSNQYLDAQRDNHFKDGDIRKRNSIKNKLKRYGKGW